MSLLILIKNLEFYTRIKFMLSMSLNRIKSTAQLIFLIMFIILNKWALWASIV